MRLRHAEHCLARRHAADPAEAVLDQVALQAAYAVRFTRHMGWLWVFIQSSLSLLATKIILIMIIIVIVMNSHAAVQAEAAGQPRSQTSCPAGRVGGPALLARLCHGEWLMVRCSGGSRHVLLNPSEAYNDN